MNVAAYVRVSTDLQAERGYSISEQTERIEAYCKAMNWDLVKIYTDPGFTGANMDRPALQELIRDIKDYDIVLVNKLDRLSRSQKDTLYLIEDVFTANNCSFVSMQESFDTSTPIGIAMVGILAAFAELERSQIKERMKMGKEGRARKGLWHGGKRPPIGYDYTNNQLIPNEDAQQVRMIFDMYDKGTGIRDIGRYMSTRYTNKYSSWNCLVTIRNILQNPVYIGMIGEHQGQHEPIIEKDVFERIQLKLDDHKIGKKVATATHLLTGTSYCGYCGSRITIASNRYKEKRYNYYRCGYIDSGQIKTIDKKCELKSMKESTIDDLVIAEILKLKMENIKIVDNSVDIVDNSVEIAKLTKQIDRLINLYASCDESKLTEVAEKIKTASERRKTLEKEQKRPLKAQKKQIMNTLSIAKETFENGSPKDKKLIIDSLIDRVIFYNDTIKIEWKFFSA